MAGFAERLRPLAHDLQALRWQRWIERGVWWNILGLLKRLKGVELKIVFLDSTVVRAHQHAAGAAQKKAIRPSVAPAAD